MIRIFTAVVASAFTFIAASCCCTSDTKPAKLRPLPEFKEIETAPAEVTYTK